MNSQNKDKKIISYLLLIIGSLSTLLAVIGLFLPLLPTVPLLLLAAACFARGSTTCHNWLLEHKRLGPLIRDYLNAEGIPRKSRNKAIAMIWISICISALLVPLPWVQLLLLFIAGAVTIYLLRLPIKEVG